MIYDFQQLKILVYQCSYSNPRGHVLVYCGLTPQENLGTSSAPSLPIHPSRPVGPTACDPLRPSSTALYGTHARETFTLSRAIHPLLSRAFDMFLSFIGQQPAKSRVQPHPQDNAPSTPTVLVTFQFQTKWKMALCRPVACLLRSSSGEGMYVCVYA